MLKSGTVLEEGKAELLLFSSPKKVPIILTVWAEEHVNNKTGINNAGKVQTASI